MISYEEFLAKYVDEFAKVDHCPCGTQGHCMACAPISMFLTDAYVKEVNP